MNVQVESAVALGWLALISPAFLPLISRVGSELGLSIDDALDLLTPVELGRLISRKLDKAESSLFVAGKDLQKDKSLEEFFA